MKILYETKNLIVFIKPPGVLSEEDGNKRSVPLILKEYLREKGVRSPQIFTVHRLDRDVGGVMVVAKNAKTASLLATAVAEHQVEKEYLAVVKGRPEQRQGLLEDLLFRDSTKGKTYVTDRMRKGVRQASLSYWLIESVEHEGQLLSLVKVRLHTGRTHQIRVQFASRKMPLVGDGRYGSGDGKERPALFSHRLALAGAFDCSALPTEHPFTLFEGHFQKDGKEEEPFFDKCIE
ncbi:MAG: RluA family pseudouridine synthase [Clostridia bacterium]|nr:RluA family pseudouridine synthase [Clostridia bacterium]